MPLEIQSQPLPGWKTGILWVLNLCVCVFVGTCTAADADIFIIYTDFLTKKKIEFNQNIQPAIHIHSLASVWSYQEYACLPHSGCNSGWIWLKCQSHTANIREILARS